MPVAARESASDDPPKLMKVRGTPVEGIVSVTPPMLISAWPTIQIVAPPARRTPRRSGAFRAALIPRQAKPRKSSSTRRVPTSPNSSPMIAKIKSVWASGRSWEGDTAPLSPVPKTPPAASE